MNYIIFHFNLYTIFFYFVNKIYVFGIDIYIVSCYDTLHSSSVRGRKFGLLEFRPKGKFVWFDPFQTGRNHIISNLIGLYKSSSIIEIYQPVSSQGTTITVKTTCDVNFNNKSTMTLKFIKLFMTTLNCKLHSKN